MKPLRLLLATGILFAFQAQASTQVYDVDPTYRQEVLEVLERLLNPEIQGQMERRGSVQLLPTGQILVDTVSDQRQGEVAAILASIAAHEPGPTPTVTLRYWLLHGEPGGENAAGLPDTLDEVIRELEEVHGPLGISILSAATVSGQSGKSTFYESEVWEIMQEVVVSGASNRLNADLFIGNEYQELAVDLTMRRGEFIVLGAGSSPTLTENGVMALVVNWPEN